MLKIKLKLMLMLTLILTLKIPLKLMLVLYLFRAVVQISNKMRVEISFGKNIKTTFFFDKSAL